MAYTDYATVKTYLGIASGDSGDDALLTALIARAQQAIDTHCRRTFEASGNTTRYLDYTQAVGRILRLDYDLCSINSVTNGDSTTVTAAQYTTRPKNRTPYYALVLLVSSGISWEYTTDVENAITISGKWAYSTTAPADVVHACIRLTAWLYRQKDTSADIDRPILAGDGSVILPQRLPGDVITLLNPYRRHEVLA